MPSVFMETTRSSLSFSISPQAAILAFIPTIYTTTMLLQFWVNVREVDTSLLQH